MADKETENDILWVGLLLSAKTCSNNQT